MVKFCPKKLLNNSTGPHLNSDWKGVGGMVESHENWETLFSNNTKKWKRVCANERERESVWERESVCVRERVCVWERVCVRKRECVCEKERVCVWEIEIEKERVKMRYRESVCEKEKGYLEILYQSLFCCWIEIKWKENFQFHETCILLFSLSHTHQCDQIGCFLKFLVTHLLSKVSQILDDILGSF